MPRDGLSESQIESRARVVGALLEVFSEAGGAPEALRTALAEQRAEDIAEVLPKLSARQRLAVFRAISEEEREVVVEEADPVVTGALLSELRPAELVDLVDDMPPDDAADVVFELPDEVRQQVLREVARSDPEQAEDIRELLDYPPNSAGGIMTTQVVRIDEGATAGSALAAIQGAVEAETIYTLFVTNIEDRLVGVVSIRDLLSHKPSEYVRDFMVTEVITARVYDERSHAASLLAHYNLEALPVVDAGGVIRGVVTADDVIDALQEEFDDDLFKMAGTARPEYLGESTLTKGRKRLPWLLVTLVFGMALAVLLSYWEALLDKHAKLTFFLPVLAAMAGSASIQSSTLVVRGLSTGEIARGELYRLVHAELRIGLLTSTICSALVFLCASLFAGDMAFGATVTIGMFAGIFTATIVGTVIPMLCDRVGVDPALSSGPFITALNDILALAMYLSAASLILGV